MSEREPQPHTLASERIAHLMGPGLLLLLLGVWAVAWLRPAADAERFVAAQQAGRVVLPEAPPPDKHPGIDNRALDPADRDRAISSDPAPLPAGPHGSPVNRPAPHDMGPPGQPPRQGPR